MLLFTEIVTKIMQTRGKKACFLFPECSFSYAKIMQTRGKKACFLFPECSFSFAKVRYFSVTCTIKTVKL